MEGYKPGIRCDMVPGRCPGRVHSEIEGSKGVREFCKVSCQGTGPRIRSVGMAQLTPKERDSFRRINGTVQNPRNIFKDKD